MTTTISITDELWKKLNSMKNRGETFSAVLDKILGDEGIGDEYVKNTKPN